MSGQAVTGRPGNGDGNWSALVKRAEQQALRLEELASGVGPDHDPSRNLVRSLDKVGACLRDVSVFVDDVRGHLGQREDSGSELTRALGAFSDSIEQALDAIEDLRRTLIHELTQLADEEELRQRRPNKRFREDQQELRVLGREVKKCLSELHRHMDGLLQWLKGS